MRIKKVTITIGFFLLFLFIFGNKNTFAEYGDYTFARLSYVKGDVYIQRATDLGYEEGIVNMPIAEGDRLGTTDGQVEVYLGKGNYLRLNHYTKVDFLNLPERGYDFISFNLWSGSIYLRVNYLERDRNLEIKTPDGSFYVLKEGRYRINVNESGETELIVIEGLVEAVGDGGSMLVKSEQIIELTNGRFINEPRYFTYYARDEFDQWNEYRDSEINRRVRSQYLPEELYDYAWELDYYGRWVYQRPYGYVWVPIYIDVGWRPYYYGRWIWLPLCGWTWVPYEPWGWSVYHYGRWHWSPTLGWYWIPTTTWGPAWVYWYWGIDYIGWGPLSYYGYPVVIINNYCYVRDYYNSIPFNSKATVFIHKNQLRARDISKVAITHNELSRNLKLDKISVSKNQPALRPVNRSVTTTQLSGKKVLLRKDVSRTEFRKINKIESLKHKTTFSKSTSKLEKSKTISRRIPYSTSTGRERKVIKKDYKKSSSLSYYRTPEMKIERKIKPITREYREHNYSNRKIISGYTTPSFKRRDREVYSSSKSRSFIKDLLGRFSQSKSISSSKKSYSGYKSSSSGRRVFSSSKSISSSSSRRSSSSSRRVIKKKK